MSAKITAETTDKGSDERLDFWGIPGKFSKGILGRPPTDTSGKISYSTSVGISTQKSLKLPYFWKKIWRK